MNLNEFNQTYMIIRPIGKGGGGQILLAMHKRLNKYVVIKQMLHPVKNVEINRREADILKRLRHSSLPGVIDYIQMGNDVYTVMDYIPGESLAQWTQHGEHFTLSQLRQIGMEICGALDALHSQNPPIFHCDIKPANVMITPDMHAVLIDFNVSLSGNFSGLLGQSRGFVSPELMYCYQSQASNPWMPVDLSVIQAPSDLYELGCLLYYLASGRIYTPEAPRWDLVEDNYVPELVPLLQKALDPDPSRRYQDAKSMGKALQNLEYTSEKMVRFRRNTRLKTVFYGLGLAVCLALGGFSVHLMRQDSSESYERIVDEMIRRREEKEYEEITPLYEEASAKNPDRLEAYYQQAASLHEQNKYKECAEFIERNVHNRPALLKDQANAENVLYLLADSYYCQNEYQKAVSVYQELFEMDHLQPVFYRDYAIALGANNQPGLAASILEEAKKRGLDSPSVQYVQAELNYASGQTDTAIAAVEALLPQIQDESLLYHAASALSEWLMQAGKYDKAENVLSDALSRLPDFYAPNLLEKQTQLYLTVAKKDPSRSAEMLKKAGTSLEKIISFGWGSYSTYNSLALVREQLKDYPTAQRILDTMEEQFGLDYNIEKRRAFIELALQAEKPNEQRDYHTFEKHYQNAVSAWNSSVEDQEMDLLERAYQEVLEGNWL